MTTETTTATKGATAEEKISQLRELFADAPEVGKRALDNVLEELRSQVSEPRSRMESAGRVGARCAARWCPHWCAQATREIHSDRA